MTDDDKQKPKVARKIMQDSVAVTDSVKGELKASTSLSKHARGQATVTALASITASGTAVVRPKVDLLADLESLAGQTEGRRTETLQVVINDPDSTCDQFRYDIGNLTEAQATQMLIQIVSRREIEEEHERELEKIQLKSSLGFFGKLIAKLFRAGS